MNVRAQSDVRTIRRISPADSGIPRRRRPAASRRGSGARRAAGGCRRRGGSAAPAPSGRRPTGGASSDRRRRKRIQGNVVSRRRGLHERREAVRPRPTSSPYRVVSWEMRTSSFTPCARATGPRPRRRRPCANAGARASGGIVQNVQGLFAPFRDLQVGVALPARQDPRRPLVVEAGRERLLHEARSEGRPRAAAGAFSSSSRPRSGPPPGSPRPARARTSGPCSPPRRRGRSRRTPCAPPREDGVTDSSLAASMKPQVFTMTTRAASGSSSDRPSFFRCPSITSVSTRFFGQPSETTPTDGSSSFFKGRFCRASAGTGCTP